MRTHILMLGLVMILAKCGMAYEFQKWPYISDKPPKTKEQLLREKAYVAGMRSIPEDLDTMKYMLDSEEIPITSERVSLGKKLFFDKRLSKNGEISCATCHNLEKGGVDGLPTAIGHDGLPNPNHLNAPTVYNSAFAAQLFWDGRSPSLQDQAKGPIQAGFEMAAKPEEIEQVVNNDALYPLLFREAIGKEAVTFDDVTSVIASYEKTLLTRSAYDRFLDGDDTALTHLEQQGMELFIDLGCLGCHSGIALGGESMQRFPMRRHKADSMDRSLTKRKFLKDYINFSKKKFMHEENRYDYLLLTINADEIEFLKEGYFDALPEAQREQAVTQGCIVCHENKPLMKEISYPFENEGGFMGQEGTRFYRVPILRNISLTAPYFHNGVIKELEDVVSLMGTHQLRRELDQEQIEKLVVFLKSLEGQKVDYGI